MFQKYVLACAALLALPGCGGQTSGDDDPFLLEPLSITNKVGFGAPLPGLTADEQTRFSDGKDAFAEVEAVSDGLGPVFNDSACGNCHSAGAVGGASDHTVTRFGLFQNGAFDPLERLGGSLIQANGIGPITAPDGTTYNYVGETVPPEANVTTKRVTTPLFGLGLVDAVPDSTFQQLAANQAKNSPRTAGVPNHVVDLATGKLAVGKFGWKGQNPTLLQFSADAYVNEMGITNPIFPTENCPQGDCTLLAGDPVKDPEDDGGDVVKFADFMSFLAPAPRGAFTRDVSDGKRVFQQAGCTNCHVPTLTTGANASAALDHICFSPYSDFLLHDMGQLGDGITQGEASGRQMRTAPLWGVRARPRLLHDGRATTIADAIAAHDGQGAGARRAFQSLDSTRQKQLVAFVLSL